MSDTNFTPGTVIASTWLNEVNDHVHNDTPVSGTTVHKASVIGFTPAGTGAVVRTVQDELRDRVAATQFDTANNAFAKKTSLTTKLEVPIGTYTLSSGVNYAAYAYIYGYGNESRITVPAGATGIAYTSQTGVYDDHPHNNIKDVRISGDGTLQAYPGTQNGTSRGIVWGTSGIGNLGSVQGCSIELHDIGRRIFESYTHNGSYNYYRANKIGLQLEKVTSYTEQNSYFRYNSTAAIDIIGGQNVTFKGGAVEGNPGIGLRYSAPVGSSLYSQINLHDVYFESNGNEADANGWSIDIPFNAPTMVNIIGGNLWRNSFAGRTSGPYRLGPDAVIDGATINSSFYVKRARVRNTRGTVQWNTFATEATARLFGLTEPTVMLEFAPAQQEYDFSSASGGMTFCTPVRGKGSMKTPGVTNLANYVYPYGFSASSGATGAANAALNYGDGDFFQVTYAASVGSFNSNYATLANFTDTTKPYRIWCGLFYPTSDCEIGIVQSEGNQSTTAFFALKANTYYRMVILAFRPMTAGSFLRVFPLNTAAPVVNYHPIWMSAHTTHAEQLGVVKMLVDGTL